MQGLGRWKHERRCSRARGEDASFRDVKIKIPDLNINQGMWVTSRTRSVGWGFGDLRKSSELSSCLRTRESTSRPGRGQTNLCATGTRALVGLRADDVKAAQHRKIVSLSRPHVEKNLNSKRWIKVSYPNQFRECRVFRIPYVYFTHPYIWLCNMFFVIVVLFFGFIYSFIYLFIYLFSAHGPIEYK